jgi:hypothetical protein
MSAVTHTGREMPDDLTTAFQTLLAGKVQLSSRIEDLQAAYKNAKPFPHVVIDGLFSNELLDALPAELGAAGSHLLSIVNSAGFLYLLSEITGVWQLLPDPYLQGAGYASMRRGDYFNVHSDRNVAYDTGLIRRLAMIVYLNKSWKPEYQGQLELWNSDATRCDATVDPLFNKTVIFEVAYPNYHGVPVPLACPADRKRQSFILYFHTAGAQGRPDIKPHTSIFAPRLHGTNRLTLRSLLRDVTPPLLRNAIRKLTQSDQ